MKAPSGMKRKGESKKVRNPLMSPPRTADSEQGSDIEEEGVMKVDNSALVDEKTIAVKNKLSPAERVAQLKELEDKKVAKKREFKREEQELEQQIKALQSNETNIKLPIFSKLGIALYMGQTAVGISICYAVHHFSQIRTSSHTDLDSSLLESIAFVAAGIVPIFTSVVAVVETKRSEGFKRLMAIEVVNLLVLMVLAVVLTYAVLIVLPDPIAAIGSRAFDSPERSTLTWRYLHVMAGDINISIRE
jgi:hypothetical protein